MGSTNPVITGIEQDGRIAYVRFVDGRNYKIQHPGNRIYLEWQKEYFSLSEGFDQAKFLDKAFEFCVIPDGHAFKPTLDSVKPREMGVWQRLLRRFLEGDIDALVSGEKGADAGTAVSGSKAKDS